MHADGPFDRRLRRLRRERAARLAPRGGFFEEMLAGELLDRVGLVSRNFGDVLLLGCGAATLLASIAAAGANATAADVGFAFATRNHGIECDEDRLPFGDDSFDLVLSTLQLDRVNDLPGALALIRKTLRPDGLFLGAFAGAGSLPRLRSAMLAADLAQTGAVAPRIHPQIDVRSAGDLLVRAGFALPVADSEALSIRYADLAALVADLRACGATNLLASRPPSIDRTGLAAARADFSAYAVEGKTTEQFEIVHLSGWAPSPTQPKPARRGSATQSLADVLRPPDSHL